MPLSTKKYRTDIGTVQLGWPALVKVYLCALLVQKGGGMVWASADPKAVVKGKTCFEVEKS